MGGWNIYHDFGDRINGRIADFIFTEDFFFNNEWILILWLLSSVDRCDNRCFGITYGGHYSYYDPCIKDKNYCCNNGMYYIPQCGLEPCNPSYRNNSFLGGGTFNGFWWILILVFFRNRTTYLPKNQEEVV